VLQCAIKCANFTREGKNQYFLRSWQTERGNAKKTSAGLFRSIRAHFSIEIAVAADNYGHMPAETTGAQPDFLAAARERLSFSPAPSWVCPCAFRPDFKAKQPGHQTHLLVDKQFHAEKRQTFVHAAVRLETLQAVHRHSQWRLDFEAQSQSVAIHSITTHRGNQRIEHAQLEKFHIVHREAGADHLDIEGIAAVTLLEDVRPGDILEWSYTLHDESLLLAEDAACMFTTPPATPIGRFHFAARFQQTRPMKWKSSSDDLIPTETLDKTEITWIWNRDNHPGTWAEENTPDWFIDYPWVQISDCPDWETVSTALAASWKDDSDDSPLAQLAQKIARDHNSVHLQIERALEFVQDEFRAIPSDSASMLQGPVSPALVERRRFGESKDLAFLLARLLQHLQVTARPILVNTAWRKSLSTLLPMPLFDHAIVEYQVRGETRWVDPTSKRQGGGSLNRIIRDYGVGLPVSPSSRLVAAPDSAAQTSLYELKELLLLDTSGAPSWLSITITARGSHAEMLRREFEADGHDVIARKRLQQCAARFNTAKRIGSLEYRDDRAANVFVLAEGFEISDFMVSDSKPGLYKVSVPNDFLFDALKMPDPETRRTPFALPYPCNISHTIEVRCLSLAPGIVQSRDIDSEFLHFTRFRKTLSGDWTTTYTLSTLADSVPAEQVEEYRDTLREIRAEATWSLLAPVGQSRPHQRGDFGKVPNAWEQAAQGAQPAVAFPFRLPERPAPATPPPAPNPAAGAPLTPSRARETVSSISANGDAHENGDTTEIASGDTITHRRRRKRHRRTRKKEDVTVRNILLTLGAVGLALVFVYLLVRGTGPSLPTVDAPNAPPTAK